MVQSVVRALQLLKLLARSDEGYRLGELARDASLPVSTTHRLLTALEVQGFAHCDGALWRVGREAYSAGSGYLRRRTFAAPALPFLRRLRDETRETVNLGVLEDNYLVTLSQVESREIVRAISPPGGRVSAFSSGMGKAILATWPDEEIADLARSIGFQPLTPRSHRSIKSVMEDIRRIRACGYAVDDEEHLQSLRCVAAVVWSKHGDPACAISVSALAMRMPDETTSRVGNWVVKAAAELTAQLGGQPPRLSAL